MSSTQVPLTSNSLQQIPLKKGGFYDSDSEEEPQVNISKDQEEEKTQTAPQGKDSNLSQLKTDDSTI